MPEIKEWTLMFYFASDNPLAPGIISQLKALKAAGFHKQANVIAQFDPYTEGTPTHIFDVNIIKKLESPDEFNIGFDSEDPFIRNLVEDKLWRDERDRTGKKLIRERIKAQVKDYAPGVPRSGTAETNGHQIELSPLRSLDEFLRFCSSRYPAKHYMLFVLGHGVAVGNDLFLFDEHADEQTVSLTGLRTVLENFKLDIQSHAGSFEMVSFHSCSVSSLEVAYELRNTANYMLASQGATFVGSWPYREILLRIFKDLKINRNQLNNGEIRTMLTKIFSYCLHNSTDFLLAGYPFDLCLCDLTKMEALKPELTNLSQALIDGLRDPNTKEAILLAHLESQSFYGEMYSDIIDFCRCLFWRLKPADSASVANSNGSQSGENSAPNPSEPETSFNLRARIGETGVATVDKAILADASQANQVGTKVAMHPLAAACAAAVKALRGTVVKNGFAGPESQYSRGLSIYFPWSRPSADSGVLANYKSYQIAAKDKPKEKPVEPTKDKNQVARKPQYEEPPPTWLDFIETYFDETRRTPTIYREPIEDDLGDPKEKEAELSPEQQLFEDEITLVYTQAAPNVAPNVPGTLQKGDKTDPMGGDCVCPSIKNYFRDTRPRRDRKRPARDPKDPKEDPDFVSGFARSIFKQSA
jgi:Clostripain family